MHLNNTASKNMQGISRRTLNKSTDFLCRNQRTTGKMSLITENGTVIYVIKIMKKALVPRAVMM
jgi:hypothetical protein